MGGFQGEAPKDARAPALRSSKKRAQAHAVEK
jgi:hypothetical protein